MFGRRLGWYTIYIFQELLFRNGLLPGAKFTLRPSLALSYIGSVTAWHSSSGRQLNFAALSRGHHLHSAGRPSRWALAHMLVSHHLVLMCDKKFHVVLCPLATESSTKNVEVEGRGGYIKTGPMDNGNGKVDQALSRTMRAHMYAGYLSP